MPVKSLPETPVYDISSVPTLIKLVPEDGKLVVLVNVIEVPDPPVPAVSFNKAPFNVEIVTGKQRKYHTQVFLVMT